MTKVKYIRTEDDEIIVFPESIQHREFKCYNPVSAGFIDIGANGHYNPVCRCYGESTSLDMKSNEEEDSELARKQILGYNY